MDLQTPNQRIIIILSAVLLAALVVGGIVYLLLPSDPTPAQTNKQADVSTEFDLSVTQKAEYLRLDARPIQEGALPVAPPAGVGKANPFL